MGGYYAINNLKHWLFIVGMSIIFIILAVLAVLVISSAGGIICLCDN